MKMKKDGDQCSSEKNNLNRRQAKMYKGISCCLKKFFKMKKINGLAITTVVDSRSKIYSRKRKARKRSLLFVWRRNT